MTSHTPWRLPAWDTICNQASSFAISENAQTHLRYLQPVWSHQEVTQLHQQVQEVASFFQRGSLQPQALKAVDRAQEMLEAGAISDMATFENFIQLSNQIKATLNTLRTQVPELAKLGNQMTQFNLPIKDPAQLLKSQKKKLALNVRTLVELDKLYARSQYGLSYAGKWSEEAPFFKLQQARIIWKAHSQTLSFESRAYGHVLGGIHQSGKTTFLESLGTWVLMNQAGLKIPAKEAHLPIFKQLRACFSASTQHQLSFLKPLLNKPHEGQLILIDDFLTQSNPGESYALARAIMTFFSERHIRHFCVSPQSLLAQAALEHPHMAALHLSKNRQLTHQLPDYKLLDWAQGQGVPGKILNQSRQHLKILKTPKKKTPLVTTPSATVPKPLKKAPKPPSVAPTGAKVKQGDTVWITSLNQYAEVLEPPQKNKVQVLWNEMEMTVPMAEVRLSSKRQAKKGMPPEPISVQVFSKVDTTCDLHQMRVFEALPYLEKFLDTAYQQGEKQVWVVHGKGEGALQQAVQNYLKDSFYVSSFRPGDYGQGDGGVTVVELA